MCVQNFSYFNGNFLPGVFPGPEVFVASAADIPETRKGPDSFNKPLSVHYTNKLQGFKVQYSGASRRYTTHRDRAPVYSGDRKPCDAMQCDTFSRIASGTIATPTTDYIATSILHHIFIIILALY